MRSRPAERTALPSSAGVGMWQPCHRVFGTRDASLMDCRDPARRRRRHRRESGKIVGGEARYRGRSLPRSPKGPRSAVRPHEGTGLGRENRKSGTVQQRVETRVPLVHRHAPRLLGEPTPREAVIETLLSFHTPLYTLLSTRISHIC
jgi:hypothetical protein